MQVEDELAQFSPGKDMLLAIGVFDGVHLGHKYLLSRLRDIARQEDLLGGVVTFRQHPLQILSPGTELPYLTALTDRVDLLKGEGIEAVILLSFTPDMAQLTAREFVGLLKEYLRMRGMVVGPDFALGKGREGDVATLRNLGQDLGFSVTVVLPLKTDGEVISSTAIRSALTDGDMALVAKLLGRPYGLRGQVTAGAGRGKGLGFPTANLEADPRLALPPDGVYATWAFIDGQAHQSMTNIGTCPTFGGHERTVEVYLLDYRDDLYGRELRVDIVERLRDEKRFDTVDELKKQIGEDVEQGRAILGSRGRS